MTDIIGDEGDDSLEGVWSESDNIRGLGGDDTLVGDGWSDTLDGGEGDDELRSGGHTGDLLIGGDGADTLISYYEDDYTADLLRGGDGDDLLIGGGSDTLDAGDGDDTIRGHQSWNYVSGGDGDDVIEIEGIYGGVISGGAGVDRLIGGGQLYGCELSGVEVLEVVVGVVATAEQLEGLDRIERHETKGDDLIVLRVGEGSVNLSDELGDLAVHMVGADGVVTGGGDDWIEMARKADGGAGDDTIEGGFGEERIAFKGADGDDSLSTQAQVASLDGGAGDDALVAWGGYRHTLLGGDGQDTISSSYADVLAVDGGAGDDVVNVRVRVKVGELHGGDGSDRLIAVGDISELTVDGFETLATRGFVRGTNAQFEAFETISGRVLGSLARLAMVETEALDLSAQLKSGGAFIVGSAGDDTISGADGDDVMRGAKGDDLIDGEAGADRLIASPGVDTLSGSEGDDVFEVGLRSRSVLDGGAGTDTLVGGNNLSALSLSGIEVLDTRGGYVEATAEVFESFETILASGSDWPANLTLARAGDLDVSAQLAGQDARVFGSGGADAVRTSGGVDLVEGADGDDTLDGSGGDDYLIGDAGDDVLVGGEGRDSLDGGAGDDLYVIDADDHKIWEMTFGGIDTVQASFSYRLGGNFEHLELAGSADLSGTGKSGANRITGNEGDNVLDGRNGADTLQGGAGRDTFLFTSVLSGRNVDEIADFRPGEDVIGLDRTVFAGLAEGALKTRAFKDISAGNADANDRILYDAESGSLYFDVDGKGPTKASLFAILDGAPMLSADDFLIT